MQELDKQTIFESLKKCEAYIQANLKVIGEPSEAEIRSTNNEFLAVEMLKFGAFVADVAHMAQQEKDHVEQMFEHMKLELIKPPRPTMYGEPVRSKSEVEQDVKVVNSPGYSVARAESEVKTDLSYIAALSGLRDIQKSAEVLKRKQRSLESILDQSRSRLSLVSKGIPT